jgi:hypothetical protein
MLDFVRIYGLKYAVEDEWVFLIFFLIELVLLGFWGFCFSEGVFR